MVLEITGNATVLQPRPPSNVQTYPTGQKAKPGRKLKDPTINNIELAVKPTKMTEIVSNKILERLSHVGELFFSFDEDCKGFITEEEIKEGLHKWGFDLSEKTLSDICNRFKHPEQGFIDYKAFSDYFADILEASGSLTKNKEKQQFIDSRHEISSDPKIFEVQGVTKDQIVGAVEVEIRKKLAEQFRTVRHAFQFFDVDRSGRIHMDEFASVLKRYGITLSQIELEELKRKTEDEHAASELAVPARKKRDVIFSSYEAKDEKAIEAAKLKAEKMKSGIRYKDFLRHFGSVLQPEINDDAKDFHIQQTKKRGKRVGHNATHKIFGSKTTSTEGKNAQKILAKDLFASFDELHDVLVFYDQKVTGQLTELKFIDILERYGADNDTATKVSAKYNNTSVGGINYTTFFDTLSSIAGKAFSSFFEEKNIVLQVSEDQVSSVKSDDSLSTSIDYQIAIQLANREGLSRICSTWKLFDRAGSGKIQGGEFINALRNTRAGRSMPQRSATALSELYDLDGTGRCDYVAFSRSFRKDLVAAAKGISKTANLRRGSLLVNTTRKANNFWEKRALESKANAEATAAKQQLLLDTRNIKKRELLLPDKKIHALASEKKKSPRFRASFDTFNVVQKLQSQLSKYWKAFTKLFRRYDKQNTGYVSPSRFAKIILSKTSGTITKEQVERLALAFVDFQKDNKPMVSYNRFMKQLVFEPMRPQIRNGENARPASRPVVSESNIITPSRPRPTTSAADVGSDSSAAQQSVAQSRLRRGSKRDTTMIAFDVSDKCIYSIYGRWKKLRRLFAKSDSKRSGTVPLNLFCETLQKNGFAVTQQDYAAIINKFCNSGLIQYHNFLRNILIKYQNDKKK
jgi:Ca2+-binding EF-hand superfamily protein